MNKKKIIQIIKIIGDSMPIKDMGFGIVSHPLISSYHWLDEGKFITLDTKEKQDKALKKIYSILEKSKTIGQIFVLVNKPYRLTILELIQNFLTEKEFNESLYCVWTMTEFPHQMSIYNLLKLFKKSNPKMLMDKEDYDFYQKLPDVVTIYRGTQGKKAKIRGLSWTLDKKKADWFANRWKLNGKVYQGKVKKVDIFLYTDVRAEKEVVVNPLCIKSLKEVKIDMKDGETDG